MQNPGARTLSAQAIIDGKRDNGLRRTTLPKKNSQPLTRPASTSAGRACCWLGRMVMLGLNFGVQVLTVRYLTKNDLARFVRHVGRGSHAVITLFGLDKALARYMAIYHEQKDYPRLFGAIDDDPGVIFSIGLLAYCRRAGRARLAWQPAEDRSAHRVAAGDCDRDGPVQRL
jgi:hypothetical protein